LSSAEKVRMHRASVCAVVESTNPWAVELPRNKSILKVLSGSAICKKATKPISNLAAQK
jgi:hypothetical protein